jgi:gentisate 1,2-dioxygenase
MYVSPETGESALETFRFSCMMLRPGEEVAPVISSANKILHVIEGAAESEIDGQCVRSDQGDVIAVPTFSSIRHRNTGVRPTFILQVDDSPLLTKLGYYEERPS